MENIDLMRQRHEKEIEELQNKCKHKELSKWIEQWWAIGHSTGKVVKVCNFCGKVIKIKSLFNITPIKAEEMEYGKKRKK